MRLSEQFCKALVTFFLILDLTSISLASANQVDGKLMQADLQQKLSRVDKPEHYYRNLALTANENWQHQFLEAFYQMRQYEPVWFDAKGKPLRDFKPFIQVLKNAAAEGLNPADYAAIAINFETPIDFISTATNRELALTSSLLRYIHDLHLGRIDPAKLFANMVWFPKNHDVANMLSTILEKQDDAEIITAFRQLAPNHPVYGVLRNSLANYRALETSLQQHEPVRLTTVIKPNQEHPKLPEIRHRLVDLGYLKNQPWSFSEAGPLAEQPYNEQDQEAIRRLQRQFGLAEDAVIGRKTLAALNLPIRQRIEKIELAMERWRWLPNKFSHKYVLANIPGFYAYGFEQDEIKLSTKIIVGKRKHRTPEFSGWVVNVKFYPDWTVPSSIAKRHVLPELKANPALIDKLGYQLYQRQTQVPLDAYTLDDLDESSFPEYHFRQVAGPKNALGMVRFSIQSNTKIYMHDTPNHSLYKHPTRTFSSGCVRVQEREKMAQFLLTDNGDLSQGEIKARFAKRSKGYYETEYFLLKDKIPVHLVYMTAWVDEQGEVRFARDIYGRDRQLAQALLLHSQGLTLAEARRDSPQRAL